MFIHSTERHLGATTQAINITKYLSELLNIKVCYIENNNHNSIIEIYNTANKEDAAYYEEAGKIEYEGIEMFMKSNEIKNEPFQSIKRIRTQSSVNLASGSTPPPEEASLCLLYSK